MSINSKKKITKSKFKKYEKEICENAGISKGVWRMYQKDIIDHFGLYDPNVTYAGRGDSRDFSLTEKIVPELYDNFIYYCHDAFYYLQELYKKTKKVTLRCYKFFKDTADDIMELMMEIANKWKNGKDDETFLPEIFHFFVKWFG